MFLCLLCLNRWLVLQAMDTVKKLYSHAPKDDVKKLEKEVSF